MHREWVESELRNGATNKDSIWSESLAVGNDSFIKGIQQQLVGRAQGKSVLFQEGTSVIKEPGSPYNTFSASQKGLLSLQNTYFLKNNIE